MSFQTKIAIGALSVFLAGCQGADFASLRDSLDRRPDLQSAAPRPQPDSRGLISYPNYTVIVARRDDTIAAMAGRIGMSPDALARHNGLPMDYRPREGEVLALPRGAVIPQAGVAGNGTTTSNLESIAATAIGRAGPGATAPVPGTHQPRAQVQAGPEPIRHVVEPGETAYSIARLYGVSVPSLASWNGLGKDLAVRNGQTLLIPVVADGSPQREVALAEPKPGQGSPTPIPPSSVEPLPKPGETVATVPASPDMVSERTTASNVPRMQRPVSGKILRGYSSKPGGNEGIDFEAATGTEVKAADAGEVALVSSAAGNSKIVLIRHPENVYTVYSNVTDVPLNKGQKVGKGQTVGKVGGGSPSFVHFEIRKGTESVDPTPYF